MLINPVSGICLFLTGFIAGATGAIAGIGGGVFVVPSLAILFRLPMHEAISTSLFSVIATSSVAASHYLRKSYVNLRISSVLALFTVSGAFTGAVLAGYLYSSTLKLIFGFFVLFISFLTFLQSGYDFCSSSIKQASNHDVTKIMTGVRNGEKNKDSRFYSEYLDPITAQKICYSPKRFPQAMLFSVLAGTASGMLGIGGGIVQVPVMHLLCEIPVRAATATSNFMLGPTAAFSALIYFKRDQVMPLIVFPVVLGTLLGSRFGAFVSKKITGTSIKKFLAFILLLTGLSMLLY